MGSAVAPDLFRGYQNHPQTSKNSRMIPEINEKVKLAIKRQQLARNIKQMMILKKKS